MDLNELEQSVLESARKQLAPSAADRMRNQAKLLQALAPPPAIGSTSHSGLVQRASVGARFGSAMGLGLGLVLGLAVGGLGGFTVGRNYAPQVPVAAIQPGKHSTVTEDPNDLDHPPGTLSTPTGAPLPHRTAPAHSAEPSEPDTITEEVAKQKTMRSQGSHSAPKRRTVRSRPQSSPPKAAVRSTLAAELAMLKRARRALEQSNAHLALGLVKSLDEQFEHGMLVEEREATRILALCQLDRSDEAKQHTAEFLKLYPRSVYEQRIAASCGGSGL